MRARVVTYNVRHGKGILGPVDIGRAARVVSSLQPQIVALQELDRGAERSGRADQVALLSDALGMPVHFARTVALRGGGEYGIGLAGRGLSDVEIHHLPRVADEEPRACIVGRWEAGAVIATHVSYDPVARARQLDHLAALAGSMSVPVVLLGDLNAGREHLGSLRAAGLRGDPDARPTFPSWWPRRQIDWVLGGGGASVVASRTVRSLASDHLPLVAEVAAAV